MEICRILHTQLRCDALSLGCCLLLLNNWFTVFIVFTMQIPLRYTLQVGIRALCFADLITFRVLDHHSFCNRCSQNCCIFLFVWVTVKVILDTENLLNVFLIAVEFEDYSLIATWSRNNLKYAEEHFSLSENRDTMPDSLKSPSLIFC